MPHAGLDRWTHPSVILVATNLSDLDRLMPYAFQQGIETGARLILLHVLGTGAGIATDPIGMPYYDPANALDFAAKTMEPWRAQARERQITCDILVREGNPAQQIAASVRQFQVGRILLGTRSRSKISKLFLGSVAEQVLRSVNLPVITVGPEAHPIVGGNDSEKVVLHATTLKETSRLSAALACQIAASRGARLVLFHVLPSIFEMTKKDLPAGLDSAAMNALRVLAMSVRSNVAGDSLQVEPRVAHGNPSIEILAAGSELGAELIILGATHRSPLQILARDRTIYRVLAHGRCPVLTLREAEERLSATKDALISTSN